MPGRSWTKDDVDKLRSLAGTRLPREIAEGIGSVRIAASKFGISLSTGRLDRTEGEDPRYRELTFLPY
jgi:hypothetical protein